MKTYCESILELVYRNLVSKPGHEPLTRLKPEEITLQQGWQRGNINSRPYFLGTGVFCIQK